MLLSRGTFRTIVVTLLTAAALPVVAEPIPIADIDQICRANINLDSTGGPVQAQFHVCFQSQQRSYDQLKFIWNTILDSQQRDCAAKSPPNSRFIYSDLLECARHMQTQRHMDEERSRKEKEKLTIQKHEFRY